MATLDQLPAEQRAIVELVVQRGRSYATLADVLQVPSERVRELARDALTELSPRTAQRVEEKWRGQIADYLLGQQSDADARLTREHLRNSETGRAWALSLLDSLDPLYPDGAVPPVPDPDMEEAEPEPQPEPEPEVAAKPEPAAASTLEDRVRERAQKQPVKDEEADEAEEAPAVEPTPKPARVRPGELSPEAQSALRRRRILGAVGGLVVLAGIVLGILAIAGTFSSDDNGGGSTTPTTASTTTTPGTGTSTTGQPIQVLGQIALSQTGKTKAQGVAYVVQQGSQKFVVVQAQVPPLPNSQKVAAYEVWLYNSNSDARSLGAQYTDKQGILQGRAELPADYTKFKSIDVSRELFADKNAGHGKASILRGNFADLKPVPQQQQGGAGTTTTPGG